MLPLTGAHALAPPLNQSRDANSSWFCVPEVENENESSNVRITTDQELSAAYGPGGVMGAASSSTSTEGGFENGASQSSQAPRPRVQRRNPRHGHAR